MPNSKFLVTSAGICFFMNLHHQVNKPTLPISIFPPTYKVLKNSSAKRGVNFWSPVNLEDTVRPWTHTNNFNSHYRGSRELKGVWVYLYDCEGEYVLTSSSGHLCWEILRLGWVDQSQDTCPLILSTNTSILDSTNKPRKASLSKDFFISWGHENIFPRSAQPCLLLYLPQDG